MSKTPNGFRAVRYCDSHRIYYVTEQVEDGWFNVTSDDGKVKLLVDPKAFKVTFCREYNPNMPQAVCARFEGKPTFTEWWTARNQKENAA
ncbi:hypothetical protein [uncultured Desulfovibrio sp.]|uniref:hypothetical protein n=1 Tax=uncultured Desulfovibrio sp. TaxID=167968 RepID=UPI0026078C03|nr:hypothetical protein [uncultured Desulfovibrio sp.]